MCEKNEIKMSKIKDIKWINKKENKTKIICIG